MWCSSWILEEREVVKHWGSTLAPALGLDRAYPQNQTYYPAQSWQDPRAKGELSCFCHRISFPPHSVNQSLTHPLPVYIKFWHTLLHTMAVSLKLIFLLNTWITVSAHCGGVTKRVCYFKESQGDFFSLSWIVPFSLHLSRREFSYAGMGSRAEEGCRHPLILCLNKARGSSTEASTQVFNKVALKRSQS